MADNLLLETGDNLLLETGDELLLESAAAPLPTTNLTAHFDASTATHVRKTGSTQAVDGDNVEEWEDQDGKDLSFWFETSSAQGPTYRTVTPLMPHACLDFDGSTEGLILKNSAGDTAKALSDVVGASAKTILISFWVESFDHNDIVLADFGAYFGVYLSNIGGDAIRVYNYDGSDTIVDLPLTIGASHVIMLRHDGTNCYASLDGGAESSVASGATEDLTGTVLLGNDGALLMTGRIGEIAIYNVDLAGQGTDLATAISYFTDKWLEAAPAPTGIATTNRKLAMMEWCQVWEPSLPISPANLGIDDRQQLLGDYPWWVLTAIDVNNNKLAFMEWCEVWEPSLPILPGTLGSDDRQQLIWGYPGVLWTATSEPPASTDDGARLTSLATIDNPASIS